MRRQANGMVEYNSLNGPKSLKQPFEEPLARTDDYHGGGWVEWIPITVFLLRIGPFAYHSIYLLLLMICVPVQLSQTPGETDVAAPAPKNHASFTVYTYGSID